MSWNQKDLVTQRHLFRDICRDKSSRYDGIRFKISRCIPTNLTLILSLFAKLYKRIVVFQKFNLLKNSIFNIYIQFNNFRFMEFVLFSSIVFVFSHHFTLSDPILDDKQALGDLKDKLFLKSNKTKADRILATRLNHENKASRNQSRKRKRKKLPADSDAAIRMM